MRQSAEGLVSDFAEWTEAAFENYMVESMDPHYKVNVAEDIELQNTDMAPPSEK